MGGIVRFKDIIGAFRGSKRPAGSAPGPATSKPKTVLFAWELGGGMGHIQRLLPIARELAGRGHRIVSAICNPAEAATLARQVPNVKAMQAPFYFEEMTGTTGDALAYNYADVLFRCGFESEDSLRIRVFYWHGLFDDIRPDLLVCDHSPTAVLAAAGRVPTVHVGSGFANPPVGRPLVTLHGESRANAEERENRVLDAIREVQDGFGVKAPKTISSLFASAETFACCLPELDPYRDVREPPAVGPLHPLPGFTPMPPESLVFGYLKGEDPRVLPLVKALAKEKIPCALYVRGAPKGLAETLRRSSVTLFDVPQHLPEVLKTASAVLHHGGLSTTEMALAAGKPQFLLPTNLEQALTAQVVETRGCGVNLSSSGRADSPKLIRRSLREKSFEAVARIAAEKVAARVGDPLATVVAACIRCLD